MTNIQIRIDEKTKKTAKKIFDDLGIDLSTGIKLYLKQVIIVKGIPFKLITENGLTPKEELEILKASEEARSGKNVTDAMEANEAIAYLKNL